MNATWGVGFRVYGLHALSGFRRRVGVDSDRAYGLGFRVLAGPACWAKYCDLTPPFTK